MTYSPSHLFGQPLLISLPLNFKQAFVNNFLFFFFTGGSSTYSPSHLFGQPLLIGLPRNGLTYDTLYDRVLSSLSRYVSPPEEGQEWWKNANSEAVNGSDDR